MTARGEPWLSRRSLLWASAATLVTACSAESMAAPAESHSSNPNPGRGTASVTPEQPVDIRPYTLPAGEVEPACKEAAVRALEAALTWRSGGTGMEAARERVAVLGAEEGAVEPMSRLFDATAWSSLRIVYPQYGGLVADLSAASVMIPCEQILPEDAPLSQRSVTVDARLVRRAEEEWKVTELLLPEPRAPTSALSTAARQVLEHDGIVLPEAARSDIEAGLVDDVVLDMLTELARQWRLDVLVFSTGHPFNVFGTDRQSNHTKGRAVDIWAVNEIPVINQGRAPWRAVMEAAAAIGATEIGGPEDVDGVRGRRPYFSDDVHQDHLHLGFEPAG